MIRKSDHLILCFVAGCAVGLIGGIAVHDFSMAAHAGEKMACKELPDKAAYYMRKPGESHSVETCQFVMRFGDPRWVPELGHPLKPKQEGK